MMRAIQSIAVDDAGFRADGKQFEGLAINADRGGRPQRRRTQKKRETRQLSTTFSACNSRGRWRRSTRRRRRTEVELGVADGRQDPKQAVVAIDDQSRVTTKAIDMQPAVDIEEGEFVDGTPTDVDGGGRRKKKIKVTERSRDPSG